VLRADGLFASFLAPPEGGIVTLRHAPRSMRTGALVSVAALVVVAAVTALGRGRQLPDVTARDAAGTRGVLHFAPAAVVVAVVAASWAADVGGWRADRRASGLDAAAARAWAGEAFAAYRAGALDPAVRLLQAARDRSPEDATICFRLGVVERARGRYNDARAAFELALEIDPSMTPARDALRAISESHERGKE
jgi:hypothetical protein